MNFVQHLMEEGDLALCTVEKVTNTITFARLPDGEEGTIVSSEIAPGRIKHMREYVVPNKKIVCKILGIDGNHIHLSLGGSTSKRKKELFKNLKQNKPTKFPSKKFQETKKKKTKGKI